MQSDISLLRGPRSLLTVGRGALLLASLATPLTVWAVGDSTPGGAYKGWIWATGVEVTPGGVNEEFCSGDLELALAPDLTWTGAGIEEVCWGRLTGPAQRALFNVAPHVGETFATQSTQPLVSASGNLYEVYGEEVEASVGQGEQRLGTVLAEPSGADLLMVSSHAASGLPAAQGIGQTINLVARSTPEVVAARTAASLEGSTWRIATLTYQPAPASADEERSEDTIRTLSLQADGVCEFSVSSVFPGFGRNSDWYTARQTDASTDLGDRRVRAGQRSAAISDCTYALDGNGNLSVAATWTPYQVNGTPGTPEPFEQHFVISDDDQFLVIAPAEGPAHDPHDLSVGYRVADSIPVASLDGEYLFHWVRSEYRATGASSSTGQTGVQETDTRGRGLLRFDSAQPGTVPAGESGDWFSCQANLSADALELGYVGDYALGTAQASAALEGSSVRATSCDYQLDADGALRVHLTHVAVGEAAFEATFRGYVNESGELAALVAVENDPATPTDNRLREYASVSHLLAMKFTGERNGNEDGDALTNFEEFQYPLPAIGSPFGCAKGELPIVCSVPDVNGNGTADLVVVDPAPIVATIRDGQDGAALGTVEYLGADPDYAATSAVVLPDLDGDGAAELGVLVLRQSDSRIGVQIRNLGGSGAPRLIWFATGHTPIAISVIGDDVDDNGVPELAVLSRRNSDDRSVVEVKNAFGDVNKRTLWGPDGYQALDLDVVPDADDDGVPEIAVLSVRNSDNRMLVQVQNAEETAAPNSLWFAKGQTPIDLAVVPDRDADGIPEVAVLSSRNSDGRLLVELKNAASAAQNRMQIWLPRGYAGVFEGLAMEPVVAAESNSVPEVAVFTRRISDSKGVVLIKRTDGIGKPRTLPYTDGFSAHNFRVLADIDGNGVEEAAVLLTRNDNGRVLVQTRNTLGDYGTRNYWFTP